MKNITTTINIMHTIATIIKFTQVTRLTTKNTLTFTLLPLTFTLLLTLLNAITASGQVQLTQYFQEHSYYNPATTGSQNAISASLNARQQWIGLTDMAGRNISPTSVIANLQAPLFNISSGIGLNIIYDNLSLENTMGVKLNYAYHMPFGDDGRTLSAGIGLSVLNRKVNINQYTLEQPGDPLLKDNTPQTGSLLDADLGFWYNDPGRLYAGLSVTSLAESTAEIGNTQYGLTRNINFTAGYYIKVTESKWNTFYLVPSFLIKSNTKNMQIDFTARAEYNNLMAGLSYRHQDALAIIAGYNLTRLRIGLSYDLTTGPLAKPSSGSAELFVSWSLPIAPKVKLSSGFNTRYL